MRRAVIFLAAFAFVAAFTLVGLRWRDDDDAERFTPELARQVQEQMAATWRADPAMKNAVIISVKLERGDGDTYRGVVQCVRGGEAFTIPLDVDAADRERIKWRLRP